MLPRWRPRMGIGHLAAGFAAKRAAPRFPLAVPLLIAHAIARGRIAA